MACSPIRYGVYLDEIRCRSCGFYVQIEVLGWIFGYSISSPFVSFSSGAFLLCMLSFTFCFYITFIIQMFLVAVDQDPTRDLWQWIDKLNWRTNITINLTDFDNVITYSLSLAFKHHFNLNFNINDLTPTIYHNNLLTFNLTLTLSTLHLFNIYKF